MMRPLCSSILLVAFISVWGREARTQDVQHLPERRGAQFHLEGAGGSRASGGVQFFHDARGEAKSVQFFFLPPARQMFHDVDDNVFMFPPMFPRERFFLPLQTKPNFIVLPNSDSFHAYRVGSIYFLADREYELFSASETNGVIYFLARDATGNFVQLSEQHVRVFDASGRALSADFIASAAKNISLLIDRSGSMQGYDGDVLAALRNFGTLPVVENSCGIYEFGSQVKEIERPYAKACKANLASYSMSAAEGGTALYTAMDYAYRRALEHDGLSVQVIISDGRPGDQPSPDLEGYSKRVPTFVLWVGQHTFDYIAPYSTAHAVSAAGAVGEIEDFFNSVAFSLHGHQALRIK